MRYPPEPDPFPFRLHLASAARTDRGQHREENQDRVAVCEEPVFYALVCDGMGGEAGGAIASRVAVESIRTALEDASPSALVSAVEQASANVRQLARAEARYARMGTTATLVALAGRVLFCAQVGDSRAYVLRDGELVQITRDQTMLQLLRESGITPVGDDGEPIGGNVILQAVGSSPRLDVVVTRTPLCDGDVVMLCSDGLHGVVDDVAIASILAREADPGRAAQALVDAANAAGGPDNISCIVVRIEGSLPRGERVEITRVR